tara:strand:+ start:983 stop:1303 length:321 start_codon:yes stop_codon:yes gene_type:complete
MTVVYKILDNNGVREATAEERAEIDSLQKPVNLAERKLAEIRKLRNRKLSETDYLGVSDNTMSDEIKTWRTNLRNIPQDNTTEAKYNELLERNADGSLKHSIWSKP